MLGSQEGPCSTELKLMTVLWRSWVKLQNTSVMIRIWWSQQPRRCSKICFIDSLKLALHVSGDCFFHLQEHFDCIYSFLEQCTVSAVCCRPVTQVGWNQFHPTCTNLYSKLKRINKTNFFCILLVAYITVLVMHVTWKSTWWSQHN